MAGNVEQTPQEQHPTHRDSDPQTLLEAVRYFADPDVALDFVRRAVWANGEPVCPHCGSREHSFLTTRRIWKCRNKDCRRQFSAKVGTIFEDSPLGWDKWLPAVWLIANSKNSVSSHELARALGVTQKTSWFMLHRIRDAMATGSFRRLSGTVELDETFIGGIAKNMHLSKRERMQRAGGPFDKTPVHGARSREDGTVQAAVLPAVRKAQIDANVDSWVGADAFVYTDEARHYGDLEQRGYTHKAINHTREYVSGDVHINGIENFWSLLKRALKGTQVHVDSEHLHRYVTERTFAYNYRDRTDLGRMRLALGGVSGRRLTWADLTDHD